ncbi:MAG TPA: RNA polymerase sigma-70 factor [Streptosporangiaceae bacterium]|nr:RNA polymerase sigma-70 factor [Streptosporangiaceae bacterium]
MADTLAAHDELRPLMFSIAYRMLGSVAEAEDIVQEAFLRLHTSAPDDLRSPEAYAARVTTRLAIDALRSARYRRERYVGPWLPEPLVASEDADPARQAEMDETLSVAFLVVLESLSPVERAVFLLREVFGYSYAEIAAVVEKSEANCRQVFRRARQHIQEHQARFEPSAEERERLARQFLAAVRDGDLAALEAMLADDVVLYADGGGRAPAVREPVRGAARVARFLLGLARQASSRGFRQEPVHANGQPAIQVFSADGDVLGVLSLGIRDGRVVTAYNQINPGKLGHLGTVGDLTVLLAGAGRAHRDPGSEA